MSTRDVAAALSPFVRLRPLFRSLWVSGVESVRAAFGAVAAWRRRRKEHKELLEFLASDHRAAADIGYRHWRP